MTFSFLFFSLSLQSNFDSPNFNLLLFQSFFNRSIQNFEYNPYYVALGLIASLRFSFRSVLILRVTNGCARSKNQPFLACLFRESDILFETLERNFIANGGLETWKSSGEKSGALEGTILSILGKSMQTLWGHYPVGKLYRQKL